jgi:glycosyltransferase involved in cell wall biosynthesis
MRIIQIIPGTGGSFYCENCVRDSALVKGLRALGHDVNMIPLYLPLTIDDPDLAEGSPLFFGAVNLYLKQTVAPLRKMPLWFQHFLDSPAVLGFAAKRAGSTRAEGLEEMTLSMLLGEEGNQAEELDHLIQWLKNEGRPDVVHLANALLLGLARRIKRELRVPVICSLQDEDDWLDAMRPEYLKQIGQVLADRAQDVDAFVPVSTYFHSKMKPFLKVADERYTVIPIGLDLSGYVAAPLDFDPPVIGFLSRLSPVLGLDILIDAFIRLKKEKRYSHIKLHLTGGITGDDRHFVHGIKKKLHAEGFLKDVTIYEHFNRQDRIDFFKTLSVLTVPIPEGDAFGTFQIESLAAGVPVVQPNIGAFPEFIKSAGGGLLYEPNDAEHLARALSDYLDQPDKARELGTRGRQSVLENYCLDCMARNMAELYHRFIGT